MKHAFFILLLLSGLWTGCEDVDDPAETAGDTEGSESGTSQSSGQTSETSETSGASVDDVERCRVVCDSLLNVDYIDVDEHEVCFTTCGQVSADEIEIFYTCWLNTSGEEESRACYQNFIDADPVDPTGDPDPDPATCVDACNAYVGMGCTPPIEGANSCAEFCGDLSATLQMAVVECLSEADGCELPPSCTLPGE